MLTYPFGKMTRSCILFEVLGIVEHVIQQQLAPKRFSLVFGRRHIQRNTRGSRQAFHGTVSEFSGSGFRVSGHLKIARLVLDKIGESHRRIVLKMNLSRVVKNNKMQKQETVEGIQEARHLSNCFSTRTVLYVKFQTPMQPTHRSSPQIAVELKILCYVVVLGADSTQLVLSLHNL